MKTPLPLNEPQAEALLPENWAQLAAACNACANIPDPETTIPALVDTLKECVALLDLVWGHEGDVFGVHHNDATDTDSKLRALLSKLTPTEDKA